MLMRLACHERADQARDTVLGTDTSARSVPLMSGISRTASTTRSGRGILSPASRPGR
jgi:hypothetical protein